MLTFPLSETTSPNLFAETAFRTVLSDYQEIRGTVGTNKANSYDYTVEAGKVTNAGRSCLIRPSDIDFVCEIEIAARHVLSPAELEYFNFFYKSCAVVVLQPRELEENDFDASLHAHYATIYVEDREAVAAMDLEIRRKMGARFIEAGIFGYADYCSPIDVSGRTLSNGTRPRRSLSKSPDPTTSTPRQRAERKKTWDREKWLHGGIRTCKVEKCTLCNSKKISQKKFRKCPKSDRNRRLYSRGVKLSSVG